MKKRLHGRDEPIFEPELPIIDAHHHLFDRPGARYLLEDIAEDIALGHDVRATVYVESRAVLREDGPEALRPVAEVEFAQAIAEDSATRRCGPARVNAAIVGYADLSLGSEAGRTLDAHAAAAPHRFRGIRQVTLWHPDPAPNRFMFTPPEPGIMTSPEFRKGFAELAARGLSFDAAVFHTQLAEVAQLARAFPDTRIVLNHLGFAMGMGCTAETRRDVFSQWRRALRDLACHPNVVAKIGGLGMPFWGFGFENGDAATHSEVLARAWRPYVLEGIEIFGPDRCMMESNFPADGHSCGYVPLWNALKKITRDFTPAEKAALYWDTAARTYGIDVARP